MFVFRSRHVNLAALTQKLGFFCVHTLKAPKFHSNEVAATCTTGEATTSDDITTCTKKAERLSKCELKLRQRTEKLLLPQIGMCSLMWSHGMLIQSLANQCQYQVVNHQKWVKICQNCRDQEMQHKAGFLCCFEVTHKPICTSRNRLKKTNLRRWVLSVNCKASSKIIVDQHTVCR